MPRYQISDEAEDDLVDIWHRTARHWDITQADYLEDQFYDRFRFLSENPYAGVLRPELNRPDLRSFRLRNTPFLIFYYPREYGIEIHRIHHGSRDLTGLFDL